MSTWTEAQMLRSLEALGDKAKVTPDPDALVYFVGDREGFVRVCVDRGEGEPPMLQRVGRGGANEAGSRAAVLAAPRAQSDKRGLYWYTVEEGESAARAAADALGAKFGGRA